MPALWPDGKGGESLRLAARGPLSGTARMAGVALAALPAPGSAAGKFLTVQALAASQAGLFRPDR